MALTQQPAPRVFISYSHDSAEHAARVLKLANDLRQDGVHAVIDQYLTSPAEGWPAWMDAHVRDDNFVVMICTETYYRRVVRKEAPGIGLGVAWEGTLIYNHLYKARVDLSRFVPVLLSGGKPDHIPDPVFGGTHYLVDTPTGYEGLLRRIFNLPVAVEPTLGNRPALPQIQAQWTRVPPAPPIIEPDGIGKRLLTYPVTYIQELFELVSGPKRFVAQRRAKGTLTMERALAFFALSTLILSSVPPYTGIIGDILFVPVKVVSYGLGILFAWRLVGGTAKLLDYLPIIFYYSPIFSFLMIISNRILWGLLRISDEGLYRNFIEAAKSGNITIVIELLKTANLLVMGFGALSYIFIIFSWFIAGWGAYRVLNGASRRRSVLAAVLFLALCVPISGILGLVASGLLAEAGLA